MPARIIVDLVPAGHRPPVPPPHTGPAVYAALLAALRDHGAGDLAAAFHLPRTGRPADPGTSNRATARQVTGDPRSTRDADARQPYSPQATSERDKPDGRTWPKLFALTPLLDEHTRQAEATSRRVHFEVSVLADPAVAAVLDALGRTSEIRLARCAYRVGQVSLAAAASYPDLLATARPVTSWGLRIVTPVGFGTGRDEGQRRTRPLPEPERVFGSLYHRWCHLAPHVPLPAGVPEAIRGHLELADLQLVMAEHLVKAGQPARRGSIGHVTYRVTGPASLPPGALAGLDTLMTFASYAGIGDRTAVGMGHVTSLPITPVRPAGPEAPGRPLPAAAGPATPARPRQRPVGISSPR